MKKIPLGVFMHASEGVIKMSRRKPINRLTMRKNYKKTKKQKITHHLHSLKSENI